MDKTHVTIRKIADLGPLDDFVPGTMEERIAMVWPLTRQACALSPHHDAEQRLQRHVTRLIRRGR